MNRVALSIVVLLSASTIALAQSPAPATPSIGLPLPPIGLPLPSISLPPPDTTQSPTPPVPSAPALVFFGVAPYGWGVEPWLQSPVPGVIAKQPSQEQPAVDAPVADTGSLQLEVRPRDAQIYVNGEFVGTWSDLEGELELPTGTHRIELRAPRHHAVSFDVRITAGRTITYRESLQLIEERQPAGHIAPAPLVPSDTQDHKKPAPAKQKFYLIPGCYLGNVPPEEVKLPAGCDLSRLITHTPGQ